MSNKYNLKKQAAYQGITVLFYRRENKYEIHDSLEGKMSRARLSKVMCQSLNIPIAELAMMYVDMDQNPEFSRAEFGIDGTYLYSSEL